MCCGLPFTWPLNSLTWVFIFPPWKSFLLMFLPLWILIHIILTGAVSVCVCVCACVRMHACTQLCPTLCDCMDCIPLASSVHGIFQARILEWVAISSSRGSPWPRDQTYVSASAALQACSLPLHHPLAPVLHLKVDPPPLLLCSQSTSSVWAVLFTPLFSIVSFLCVCVCSRLVVSDSLQSHGL